MDPWRDAAIDAWRDWRQGVIVDWPDRYTAAVVEAVRLIEWEHKEAVAEAERRRWADQERRRRVAAGG